MKNLRLRLNYILVLVALAAGLAPLRAADWHYLTPGVPDPVALLAPPPLPGSPEQAADLDEVHAVSRNAPTNDVAIARTEKKFDAFNFTSVIGNYFQPGKFPATEKLFRHVQKDAASAVDSAKLHWKRPRPYTVDPSLASGKLETSYSYPSGHSTETMVLGLVLADLFPDKQDALLTQARRMGWHRVQIGRHYPTDIYAGRVFAQAIVRQMNTSPAFQRDFAAAKAEMAGHLQSASSTSGLLQAQSH